MRLVLVVYVSLTHGKLITHQPVLTKSGDSGTVEIVFYFFTELFLHEQQYG